MTSALALFQKQNFVVVDNFVSPLIADLIEERLLNNTSFPWYAAFAQDDFSTVRRSRWGRFSRHRDFLEGPQLCHAVVASGNVIDPGELRMIEPLRQAASRHSGGEALKVDRCKYNLQFQRPGNEKRNFNCPHRDCEAHQLVVVYYVNDSDSGTYLFGDESLTPLGHVLSKKGRAVLFSGEMLHAGQHPINSPTRCVINLNFTVVTGE